VCRALEHLHSKGFIHGDIKRTYSVCVCGVVWCGVCGVV
jgi:hypothetical protein